MGPFPPGFKQDIIELMSKAWRLSGRTDDPKYKQLLEFIGNLLEDTHTTSFIDLSLEDYVLTEFVEMTQD